MMRLALPLYQISRRSPVLVGDVQFLGKRLLRKFGSFRCKPLLFHLKHPLGRGASQIFGVIQPTEVGLFRPAANGRPPPSRITPTHGRRRATVGAKRLEAVMHFASPKGQHRRIRRWNSPQITRMKRIFADFFRRKAWLHCKKVFQHGDTEDTEKKYGGSRRKFSPNLIFFLLRALCVSVVKVFSGHPGIFFSKNPCVSVASASSVAN